MLEFRQRLRDSVNHFPNLPDDHFELHFDVEMTRHLLEDGYVEPAPEDTGRRRDDLGGGYFRATRKGFQVINASAAKPIRRATAQKALDGLLSRMVEAEADPYTWWVVRRAVLFGSMLDDDRAYVSDVDVAVEFMTHPDPQRTPPREARLVLSGALMARSPLPKDFRWRGETQVRKYLQNRQRSLSLMNLDERGIAGLGWDVPHRIIYDRERGGQLDR